jgi:hypothetical protein
VIDRTTNDADDIDIGDLPQGLRLSPDGKRLYIDNFGKTGARPTGHEPDVAGDFVQRDSLRAQRTRKVHERVMGTLHRKLVRRSAKGQLVRSRLGCRAF